MTVAAISLAAVISTLMPPTANPSLLTIALSPSPSRRHLPALPAISTCHLSSYLGLLTLPFVSSLCPPLVFFEPVSNSVPITILKRPTPPTRQPVILAPPPVAKILINPKRQAATVIQAATYQIVSPAPIPPKPQSEAHVSFAVVIPADYSPRRRGGGRAAPPTPVTGTGFRPERMVRLPKVIIHEPVWWDHWTDVHHPGTSYGQMLDVPPLNWRGKLDINDLVRYYPKERSAEQALRILRALERSKTSRRSAARRHECSCQKAEKARSQATPATPRPSTSATCPTAPTRTYF
ncbi:hypothetical protein BJY52DRAFT_1355952 [Lactarius psammicola]|nr:hypothetical protein BJY52DRAFT_1355952 [Lactarius psammicola]